MPRGTRRWRLFSGMERSKNFTFVQFIDMLREAFDDTNVTDESFKITKLLSRMRYPEIGNVNAIISRDPHLNGSFEQCVAFVQEQINDKKLQTKGNPTRSVASAKVEVIDDSSFEESVEQPAKIKSLQRKLKNLRNQLKKSKD